MNILITGASKGIGKAIALKMASRGHHLSLCARNIKNLEALAAEIKREFSSIKIYIQAANCNIREEVISFAEKTIAEFGFIDVIINNAGAFKPSRILDEDEDSLQSHLDVNLLAPYYLYKKLGPLMRDAQKGYIVNICSVASKELIVDAGSYCVTKAALLSLNNIMRKEMMDHGVKVTAILPGSTLTSSWEGTTIPSAQFVQPEDVAEAVDAVLNLSVGANIEEITIKPLHGQI
jgi:3-oxoacyl-[acyl-carrier protein] reductase